jgi:hypothetical protein
MSGPDTLSSWLREQAWPIIFVLIAVGLVYLLLKLSSHSRIQKLIEQRKSATEQTFTEGLQRFGFDPAIATATYRYLQQVQQVRFPILPEDALDEDLGLGLEDVEQTVQELGLALNRQEAPGLRFSPLVTVEDLVRLLQASPRTSASKSKQYTSAA